MAFTPKTAPFSGKVNAVTLGTGDKAIVIGGQNVMPFYTFGRSRSERVLRGLHHHGRLCQEG